MISIYYSSPNPMISSILQKMDLGCCFLVFVKHIVVVGKVWVCSFKY